MALAGAPPRKTISSRRDTLLVYVVLMLFAVPVWWRTTEVYRAHLPFHTLPADMEGYAAQGVLPTLRVMLVVHDQVSLGDAGVGERTARWLEQQTARFVHAGKDGVRVAFSPGRLDTPVPLDVVGDDALDRWLAGHVPLPGGEETFTIFLLPERGDAEGGAAVAARGDGARVLTMGLSMHGWLAVPRKIAGDAGVLKAWLDWLPHPVAGVVCGERGEMSSALVAAEVAGATSESQKKRRRREQAEGDGGVRALGELPSLRLTLSLLVGGDATRRTGWDVAEAAEEVLGPLARRLRPVFNLSLDSQVLHFADLAVTPEWDATAGAYTLASSTLSDFINSKEWSQLDLTSSVTRTLHLLLYLPSPETSPLHIIDASGARLVPGAFLIQGYGGVVVLERGRTPEDAGTLDAATLRAPLHTFAGQVRRQLGLDLPASSLVRALPDPATGVPQWQLSALVRKMARVRMASAAQTLRTLKNLIEDIPNMVIRDEIASQVVGAISHLERAHEAWSSQEEGGGFEAAAAAAGKAISASEQAFFDPSILSLLYFPDDHKMAVYIPYFVPVLLPVLMAVAKEVQQLAGKGRRGVPSSAGSDKEKTA